MPRMKFGIDGAGKETQGGDFYDGPPPPKGTYKFKLKRLEVGETKGGPNAKLPKGTPTVRALLEIVGPASAKKFHGAGIFRTFVITEASAGFFNQFLNALTDGSEMAVKRIQKAFWDEGPFVDKDGHITKIGKLNIGSPEGERELTATTKITTFQGEKRAEIARFLMPVGGSTDLDDEEADEREDDEDLDEDLDDDADADDDVEDDDDDESDDDDDEESDDDSESDDEEEDEDEEEEAAPAKKSKKSKAPF